MAGQSGNTKIFPEASREIGTANLQQVSVRPVLVAEKEIHFYFLIDP